MNYPENIITKARAIKLIIFDVDGVFTNGQIFLTNTDEIKVFHSQDGYGLKILRRNKIELAIISGRESAAVTRRMKELDIQHVYQGIKEKLPVFEALLKTLNITAEQCAYVGDDVPDMPVMERVGLKIAVANATAPVKAIADWQTINSGGHGAVREVCELFIHALALEVSHGT